MLKNRINLALILVLVVLWSSASVAYTPDWLRSAAQQAPKHYAGDVNSVELLSDSVTTVKGNSEIVTHLRIAFRILRPEGKDAATFYVPFDNETKINYLKGWSITGP